MAQQNELALALALESSPELVADFGSGLVVELAVVFAPEPAYTFDLGAGFRRPTGHSVPLQRMDEDMKPTKV